MIKDVLMIDADCCGIGVMHMRTDPDAGAVQALAAGSVLFSAHQVGDHAFANDDILEAQTWQNCKVYMKIVLKLLLAYLP